MPTTHKIVFWNIENFFGSTLNRWTAGPDKLYDEKAAGSAQFEDRLDLLADRLAAISGTSNGPDVLGLCEVETDPTTHQNICDGLNTRMSSGYNLATIPVRSNRAISPILLTRWTVTTSAVVAYDQRILKAKCTGNGTEIFVYVCHWPSKVGDKTGEKRLRTAKILYDSIVNCGAGKRVLVMGDFNDNPMSTSLNTGLKARDSTANAVASVHPDLVLYDLMTHASYSSKYSHYFVPRNVTNPADVIKGRIDHICCTGTLLTGSPIVNDSSVGVWDDVSISKTQTFTGYMDTHQRPWNYGQDDPPGYADHWPVYCTITWS